MSFSWGFIHETEGDEPATPPTPGPGTVVRVRPDIGPEGFPSLDVEMDGVPGSVVVTNAVFPSARPGDRVLAFANPNGGLRLHCESWMLPGPGVDVNAEPLTLADLLALFVGHEAALRRLLRDLDADRGSSDSVVPRHKLDELRGRIAGFPDEAFQVRGWCIDRLVTYGDPVLPRPPRKKVAAELPHYGWPAGNAARGRPAVISDVGRMPVGLKNFEGELRVVDGNGKGHPRPGLYLWALAQASLSLESVKGRVLRVGEDWADVEVYGVPHRLPRHAFTWSPTRNLSDLLQAGDWAEFRAELLPGVGGVALTCVRPEELPAGCDRGTLFEPGTWRVQGESAEGTALAVRVGESEVSGIVRDRWFPEWDQDVLLEATAPRCNGQFRIGLRDVARPGPRAEEFEARWKTGETVTGVVVAESAAGLVVDVGGVRCVAKKGAAAVGETVDWVVAAVQTDRRRLKLRTLKAVYAAAGEDTEDGEDVPEVPLRGVGDAAGFAVGDTVSGVVTRRVQGGLIVEIGVDAFMPGNQIDLKMVPDKDEYIGRQVECKVIRFDDEGRTVVVSRRKVLEKARATDRKLFNERYRAEAMLTMEGLTVGGRLEGVVKNITEFGVFVALGGVDGLLHVNEMSWGRPPDPWTTFRKDQRITVYVLSVDRDKGNIVLSLKRLTPSPWERLSGQYTIGSRHTGEVANLMTYGAFVELQPGIEGLVHISEMSWTRRINHPSEVVSIGDTVEVEVLGVNKDIQQIALSMKQVRPNPWDKVAERFPPNTVVSGVVRNITNYGAFIEIKEGEGGSDPIDGLLHNTDMSWVKKVAHPSEVVQMGERVVCIILNVDQARKRIALGLKQLNNDPWEGDIPGRFRPNEIKSGRVTKLTNFGVFVELEPGLEGLLHISELADHKVERPDELFRVGDVIEVKVLRVDVEDRKIGLSHKRVGWSDEEEAAWEEFCRVYPIGGEVRGRVFDGSVNGHLVEVVLEDEGVKGWLDARSVPPSAPPPAVGEPLSGLFVKKHLDRPKGLLLAFAPVEQAEELADPVAEVTDHPESRSPDGTGPSAAVAPVPDDFRAATVSDISPGFQLPWGELCRRYPVDSTVRGVIHGTDDLGRPHVILDGGGTGRVWVHSAKSDVNRRLLRPGCYLEMVVNTHATKQQTIVLQPVLVLGTRPIPEPGP